jgi:ribosomal subunit interface protein
MKITIYGKQMSVRDSLKAAIEKKLMKFNKFFGEETEAAVTCKTRKGTKIIEITVNYGSTTFRSEEESDTFITALDRAAEGLERQIRKNKTRLERRLREGAFAPSAEEAEMEPIEEDENTTNTVHVTPDSVWMEHSTCDNQDCVDQGTVSLDNMDKRVLYNMIICLPNEVVLELHTPETLASAFDLTVEPHN